MAFSTPPRGLVIDHLGIIKAKVGENGVLLHAQKYQVVVGKLANGS